MRKHAIAIIVLVALAVLLGYLAADTGYDWQAIKLVLLRIVVWFLAVTSFLRAKSLTEDDDYEEDWKRIDDGNIAVGIYRAAEFVGVGVAIAMLVAKI